MAKHGGKRRGAGRKQTRAVIEGGSEFCQEIADRVSELNIPKVKTFADYVLHVILGAHDTGVRKEGGLAILHGIFGKPPQRKEISGPGGGPIPIQLVNHIPRPTK